MSTVRQYTTPTIELEVENQLIANKDVYVTFAFKKDTITFRNDDITMTETQGNTDIAVPFTQEQTALFEFGEMISIQVNWMDGTERCGTDVAYVKVTENLLKEILE